MKTDRLIGILSILLQEEKTTAPELAEKFEVSRRTINRDIEDLCKAGIPIRTAQGTGGGISIMDGYRMDRTILTSKDMQMILAGLRSLDSVSGNRYYGQLMEKIQTGSSEFISERDSMLIDLSSWYKGSLVPKIEVIQNAIENRHTIQFKYYAPSGDSNRRIEPYYLVFRWSSWYVWGWCLEREDYRLFKLNRMDCVTESEQFFMCRNVPMPNLSNEKIFPGGIKVKVLFAPDVKWRLVEEFGPHCFTRTDDGRLLFSADYTDMEKSENPLTQSLNGQWEFAFSKNVMDRPENFYEENFDASSFDKIMVPGHIELAGYDKIRYINTMYPWEGKEYHRGAYSMGSTGDEAGMFSEAEYNPVGSYIKRFDLSEQMREKKIRICFEGVEEAMYLWLNGQFVGYAEDSFTPSEFDLTPFIREKGNVLAVQVHKMSTAAFLEDQDFFRFFGIFRNVTLKAVPEVHLEDVWFQPTLNKDNASGRVSVKIKVTAPEGKKVAAHFVLKDRENNQVAEDNITLEEKDGSLVGVMDTEVGSVKAWDNHCPYLYHAYVELRGEDGEILEIIPYDIGFRRLEMIDKVIYLNGKRLVITGVNRHEWSAKTGRSISMDEMTADIDCMIRNNINAVRTCHYPDQIPWYYLCDKAGIYVMAETNMESHGTFQKLGAIEPSCSVPCSIPQWREAVVDRARSNFETFKNHTAILFWSLGNESYAGDDIEAMNTYFKEKQDGRFVHYESSFYDRNYEETISDVESRMYAKPYEVEEYLNNNPKKPYLLCEYMHDMGNSMGGLGTYMKLIDKYEMYHGGFIWDFIDQALLVKDEVTGKEVLRYGGDFDDKPSDYEFSGNGIVFADRKEKPAMQEVRYYYGLYR